MTFRRRSFPESTNRAGVAGRRWRVRLGAAAELDFANILRWAAVNFGPRQSRVYRDTLIQAIGELADGPDVAGSKVRDEIMPGLRTLHIARGAAVVEVTSSCTAQRRRARSKSSASCTTGWTFSATLHLPPTMAGAEAACAPGQEASTESSSRRAAQTLSLAMQSPQCLTALRRPGLSLSICASVRTVWEARG